MNLTLDQIDETKLADAKAYLRAFLKETYPSMDLEAGRVFHDLLLQPGAEILALTQQQQQNLLNSNSLLQVTRNPDLADAEALDRILSNYMTYRKMGTYASGRVTIIVNNDATTTVGAGDQFMANGLTFVTVQPFIGTTGALSTQYSRRMVQRADGSYSFTIDVVAEAAGSQYMLKQDTRISWTQASANYVDSLVESDFVDGTDTETNEQLITSMQEGISVKVLAGRVNISALLREQFSSVIDVSIVGNGDGEMKRDLVFGVSTGGKVDIYSRTASQPVTRVLEKDCTLVDRDEKIFKVVFGRDDYPGFYDVMSIRPLVGNTQGSLEKLSETRAVDTSGFSYTVPLIPNQEDGVYTRYQTTLITFKDPAADITDMVAGDTAGYNFDVVGVPDIDLIQDFVADRSRRAPTADYLVKAPIPMFVAINLVVGYTQDDGEVPVDAVKLAVVNAVNGIGFSMGRLPASLVIDAAQGQLTGNMAVRSPVNMVGAIRKPDGGSEPIRSQHELVIPYLPDGMISQRTVCMYTTTDSVSVSTELLPTRSIQ